MSYEIDPGKHRIAVRLIGAVSDAEVLRACDELLADPGLTVGLDVLSDHSELESVGSAALVHQAVGRLARMAEILGPFRCAVVAPRPASFGMARMASALAERTPATLRAFRTLAEAEAWLGEARSGESGQD